MKAVLGPKAQKYLDRQERARQKRVLDALEKLERDPPQGDIEPIIGQKGYFRAKVGGLRILYTTKEGHIFVTNIVPRGQAYNKKERKK